MKIYIGTDHAGYELKEKLKPYLIELGHEVEDMGAFEYESDDDYPDYIRPVAEATIGNTGSMGIVLGGSGQGEAICANKVAGARAIVFYGGVTPKSAIDVSGTLSSNIYEILKLGRIHNDANILSLGARFITEDEARNAVRLFIETSFLNEERNVRRIQKI